MPQIIRLRLVSVGHRDAWMDDITLDFVDAEGRPTDSALWLRNGGGKSTILSLLFSLVQPSRSEFLGARGEAKQRRLEHYISPHVPALVACEWELEPGSVRLYGDGQRYLTGVFYENLRSEGSQEARLRRLFFGGRISDENPRFALADLPLYIERDGERRTRRNFSSFREEWQRLRQAHPHLNLFEVTDAQHTWMDHLDSLGIDPELFNYQIQMNLREGGAQDLFKSIRQGEDFADFLLRMVMSPDHAQDISRNINLLRERLHERCQQLLPERELVTGLIERLQPVERIAKSRKQVRQELCDAQQLLLALKSYADSQTAHHEAEKQRLSGLRDQEHALAEECRRGADEKGRIAAALRRFAARLELDRARQKLAEQEEIKRQAERAKVIWKAALPLREALRHEEAARSYQNNLDRKEAENAPLHAELVSAARALKGTLGHQARASRLLQQEKRAQLKSTREEARQARDLAAECERQAALAEQQAQTIEGALAAAERERVRLVRKGALLPDERAVDAVQRIQGRVHQADQRCQTIREELTQIAASRTDLSLEERTLHVRLGQTEQSLDSARRQYDVAMGQKGDIEQLAILRESLESPTLNLEELSDQSVTDLHKAVQMLMRRSIEMHVQQADDRLAVEHLEEESLLPPSPDVLIVLSFLDGKVTGAWSGWQYIEKNYRDNTARWAVARLHPEIAMGVVVRPQDFAVATAKLREAHLPVRMPVVVASHDVFAEGGRDQRTIVAPETNAYFDRSAGAVELQAIQARLTQADGDIRSVESRRDDLLSAVHRLEDFRRRYPRGWFSGAQTEVEKFRMSLSHDRHALDELGAGLRRLDEKQATLTGEDHELQQQASQDRGHLEGAESFNLQHEEKIPGLKDSLVKARDAVTKQRSEASQWQDRAQELDLQAGELENQSDKAGEQAVRMESEAEKVGYLEGVTVELARGDSLVLQDRYNRLKDQYEAKVSKSGLLPLIQKEQNDAQRERRRLHEALSGKSVTEEDVRRDLDTLSSSHEVENMAERADDDWTAAWSSHGHAANAVKRADAQLKTAEESCNALGGVAELSPPPATAALAESEAQQADEERRELDRLVQQHEEQRQRYDVQRKEHEDQARQFHAAGQQVDTVHQSYSDLLDGLPAPETGPGAIGEMDVATRAAHVGDQLRALRGKVTELNEQRDTATQKVQSLARRAEFQTLRGSVAPQFADVEPSHLEDQAEAWMEKLAVRLKTIDDLLAETDAQRGVLLGQLQSLAEEGIQILDHASARSKLPDQMSQLGGARFLLVKTETPEGAADRQALMANLLDQFIEEGNIPTGIELVLRSVRRLARRIQFKILHPDPSYQRRHVDIVEMGRFSGGEQLTSAILLFCTLAQLRARNRGRSPGRTSVLILDNPIGNSSHPQFLRLQREVAKAMRVQLIYTTAVHDFDALNVFPKLIRLRNERVDRNTHRHMLEMAPADAQGILEAVHIGKIESDEGMRMNNDSQENRTDDDHAGPARA